MLQDFVEFIIQKELINCPQKDKCLFFLKKDYVYYKKNLSKAIFW